MSRQRRVGFVLSMMVVIALSGGVWARETRPAAATSPVVWRMEAEAGALTATMAVGQDDGASVYGYVAAPGQTGAVTYTLDVPTTGQHYPWARVKGTACRALAAPDISRSAP